MDNKKSVVKEIVDVEWEMFASVNEGSRKAACQEDRVTFVGMRAAQFDAWPIEALVSYLGDLEDALVTGRNLIEEKYIRMMENTEPTLYAALQTRIRTPSDEARAIAREVSDILLEQTRELFKRYPFVTRHSRPLYASSNNGSVSLETYQLCELLTYSEKTLSTLRRHIEKLEKDGISLAREILENTVKHYGYETLEKAETATMRRTGAVHEVQTGRVTADGDSNE